MGKRKKDSSGRNPPTPPTNVAQESLSAALRETADTSVRRNSAATPLIQVCLIAVLCLLLISLIAPNTLVQTLITYLTVGVLSGSVLGLLYFVVMDPDRLHTEEHIIQRQHLRLLQTKAGKITSPERLRLTDNPEVVAAKPQISDSKGPTS